MGGAYFHSIRLCYCFDGLWIIIFLLYDRLFVGVSLSKNKYVNTQRRTEGKRKKKKRESTKRLFAPLVYLDIDNYIYMRVSLFLPLATS